MRVTNMSHEQNFDEILGQNLKALREKKGLSQKELGEALSETVALQQIQKYEKGVNRISAQRLYEFSVILQCPIMGFFAGIKNLTEDLENLKNLYTITPEQRNNIQAAAENLIDIMKEARVIK